MTDIQLLNADQFRRCLHSGDHCLVDVRNVDEFNAGSAATVCWPVGDINDTAVDNFVRQHNLAPEQTVVLVCASGKRAHMAAQKLHGLIPNPIAVLQGGMAVLRGGAASRMSIERQVRIAAGSLVVLGALAALWINPLAVVFCLLIGGGLVFAGITDWCGMGLLLMRMPWNRG